MSAGIIRTTIEMYTKMPMSASSLWKLRGLAQSCSVSRSPLGVSVARLPVTTPPAQQLIKLIYNTRAAGHTVLVSTQTGKDVKATITKTGQASYNAAL